MVHEDILPLVGWLVELPLMGRYGMTVAKATANFETGLARGDWLIVADGDSPAVGFAWAIPRGAFGRSPYLRLIGVHADAAGAGVGTRLLDEIERMAAEVAADLFLLVSDFNEGAQRLYQRQGYTQIGAIPGYVQPEVTELIFRKHLK
jgi:ribosomal protein S18 acetylase RimI-like enzyme